MAQSLTLYDYIHTQHLLLISGPSKTRNAPMNNRILKVYKGVDNTINFDVKNEDRKPVKLTSQIIQANLVNHQNKKLIFSRTCKVEDDHAGKVQLTILDSDVAGIDEGLYDLAFTYTNHEGSTKPLFTDHNDKQTATIQILDGSLPKLSSTVIVNSFAIDPQNNGKTNEDQMYSSGYAGDAQSNDSNGLHTFAAYTTAFTGKLYVDGTLDAYADSSAGWFPVRIGSVTDYVTFSAHTGITPFNFSSNIMWVRFSFLADSGTSGVDKILYRT